MSKSTIEFLTHILIEADYIAESSKGKSYHDLLNDPTWQRAIVRSLEIIGEATKKVDEDFRLTFPNIEWRMMAKMRDKLIHHYFGVDYEIVWDVITTKISPLAENLKSIIDSLQTD